jgi:hypothetical protein
MCVSPYFGAAMTISRKKGLNASEVIISLTAREVSFIGRFLSGLSLIACYWLVPTAGESFSLLPNC